jgi:putative acetyltransferase
MTDAIEVRREDLESQVAKTLITALNAELTATYPGEGETFFGLESAEVADGQGAFLVAYLRGVPVGCGAIRKLDPQDAEIKRMYVDPAARGHGVGRRLLAALEAEAGGLEVARVVLETGLRQHAAIALYRGCGFEHIAPFGQYVDSPVSVCMAKTI